MGCKPHSLLVGIHNPRGQDASPPPRREKSGTVIGSWQPLCQECQVLGFNANLSGMFGISNCALELAFNWNRDHRDPGTVKKTSHWDFFPCQFTVEDQDSRGISLASLPGKATISGDSSLFLHLSAQSRSVKNVPLTGMKQGKSSPTIG